MIPFFLDSICLGSGFRKEYFPIPDKIDKELAFSPTKNNRDGSCRLYTWLIIHVDRIFLSLRDASWLTSRMGKKSPLFGNSYFAI